jgi:hypothetical protein
MHATVPPEDALISPRSADSVTSDHTGAVASSTFLEQTYPPRCWLCRGRQYLRDVQRCATSLLGLDPCAQLRAPACSLHACLKPLHPDCLGRCWSHHDLKGSGESTQRVLDDLRAQARQVDSLCAPLSTTSFNVYVARGDEPHQLAAPLGVPSRLGTTSDAPHWLPGHLMFSARPLV